MRNFSKVLVIIGLMALLWPSGSVEDQLPQCGLRTDRSSWPWHAALYFRTSRSARFICSGTLISDRHVVTSASCVAWQVADGLARFFVRLGVYDLRKTGGDQVQEFSVQTIERFSSSAPAGQLRGDIVLLRLSRAVQFTDFVQPACVDLEVATKKEPGTVVGWGLTMDGEVSNTLQNASMLDIDLFSCSRNDAQTVEDDVFCAGHPDGTNLCNADSGAGLFFLRDNRWYLGGVVSFDRRTMLYHLCRLTGGYASFIKVARYREWIGRVANLAIVDDGAPKPRDLYCEANEPDPGHNYPLGDLLPADCGVYTINRIVRGERTRVFEFPWMAIMRYEDEELNTLENICLGTLVSKRYVLTTARCVRSDRTPFQVRLGEHTIDQDRDCNQGDDNDCAPPVRDYDIECIVRHPRYNRRRKQDNIALIRTSVEVTFEDHIQPICLPIGGPEWARKTTPQQFIIAGWGDTGEYGERSTALLKATVPVAPMSECQSWALGIELDGSHLCAGAGAGEADACAGDGGGPLGYPVPLSGSGSVRMVQFGIVSFGAGCGAVASVYTNVAQYADWLGANMRA